MNIPGLQEWIREGTAGELDAMAASFGASEVVMALMDQVPSMDDQARMASRLAGCASLRRRGRRIRTIGMFYYRLYNGGVERVCADLCRIWTSAGYRVVMMTDREENPDDEPLPEGVRRVILPDTFALDAESRRKRFALLQQTAREEDIDLFVDHAWLSRNLLWDLLAFRTLGIPAVVYSHNIFSGLVAEGNPEEMDLITRTEKIAPLADAVVCLSDANRAFWSRVSPCAVAMVNPCPPPRVAEPGEKKDPMMIVWVGRLAKQKQPLEAVRVMAEVHRLLPDARLHMLGKAEPGEEGMEAAVRAEIVRLGLEDVVLLEGFRRDTARWYRRAALLLMTSAYEGLPMVIIEAKSWGLPCVMYDLPYVSVAEKPEGVFTVPPEASGRAAEVIVDLLKNPEKRVAASRAAKASAALFSDTAILERWESVFRELERQPENRQDASGAADRIMLDTMMEHTHRGIQTILEKQEEERKDAEAGLLNSIFDARFYAERYPDLMAAFGYDENRLLGHFLDYGMNEGRQGCARFEPKAYRARYPDLEAAFGDNIRMYYLHFLLHGRNEHRLGI